MISIEVPVLYYARQLQGMNKTMTEATFSHLKNIPITRTDYQMNRPWCNMAT